MNLFSIFGERDRRDDEGPDGIAPSSPTRRIAAGGVTMVTTNDAAAAGREKNATSPAARRRRRTAGGTAGPSSASSEDSIDDPGEEGDPSPPRAASFGNDGRDNRRLRSNMGLPLSIRFLKYVPYCPHCAGPSGTAAMSSAWQRQQELLYEQVHSDMLLNEQLICQDAVSGEEDDAVGRRGTRPRAGSSDGEDDEVEGEPRAPDQWSPPGTVVAARNAASPPPSARAAITPAAATATTASSSTAMGTAATRSPLRPAPTRGVVAAAPFVEYDLPSLRRLHRTRASPFVVAPMMLPDPRHAPYSPNSSVPSSLLSSLQDHLVAEYLACCQFYGNRPPNAGILTTLRFSLPSLRVVGSFQDADMLALAELLLKYANGPLRYLSRLDFGMTSQHRRGTVGDVLPHPHIRHRQAAAGFRSHGALSLAKVLQQTRFVAEVYVSRNRIGAYGASALFLACSQNPTVQSLHLRRCRVGERGALAFCDLCVLSPRCGLRDVDLSANFIGFRGIVAIEAAMKRREEAAAETRDPGAAPLTDLAVNLEGNLVLQEVMNGVTHGLGVLLAFLGSFLLSERVKGVSSRHQISCLAYSTSLVVLYVSSTLFHSFFTMLHTRYIFAVIDKCAIYILIAGSYTPFLQVALWHEPLYSTYLLTFIWVCCFLGICVEAFLPGWKHTGRFSLAMYLGMGWSALVCLPDVARVVPEGAMNLMVLGGVAYTAGVPFFVRDNNLDHAVWHLFVLGGSIFHWCGIYFYVATLP